jgi:hypothetical protein
MAFLVPKEFLAVAFDSGGVTTGPITVPFIMALGAGLTALHAGRRSEEDSFGVVALCSIGPILAVMVLGLCYRTSELSHTPFPSGPGDHRRCGAVFCRRPARLHAGGGPLGLLPICGLFHPVPDCLPPAQEQDGHQDVVGIALYICGVVLFLTGVNVGFLTAGHYGAQMPGCLIAGC